MRILVLTNLYPPHHAGTYDFRCQTVTDMLQNRGHDIQVLTSSHGIGSEQRDEEIHRRLRLNGAFGHPAISSLGDLKRMESHNHNCLRECLQGFNPDLVHVFSLSGLSKSFIYALRNTQLPTVYDVADHWMSREIRTDSWLRWWNLKPASFGFKLKRGMLELSGFRNRWDHRTPTRMMKGYDRLPDVYGTPEMIAGVEPDSIAGFRFERVYFCSQALKRSTERAGFKVSHSEVIYPGIPTGQFVAEVKPASASITKFLTVSSLDEKSGVMTALHALVKARENGVTASLSIYGRGDSGYVAQLRSYAVQQQLAVEFLNVSNLVRDLPSVYRRHDAFLYTAEWDEPFAIPPVEAMASGLPVIGAKSGGACELFRNGETAWLYPPGDSLILASRVQELQMQPVLRYQMAETAQQEALSRYNESAAIDQIENYLTTSMEFWQHN